MLAMSYYKVEGPCAAEGSVPFGRALLGWCPRRRSAARLRSRPHSSAAPVDQRCPTGHFYRVLARSRLLSQPSGVAPCTRGPHATTTRSVASLSGANGPTQAVIHPKTEARPGSGWQTNPAPCYARPRRDSRHPVRKE